MEAHVFHYDRPSVQRSKFMIFSYRNLDFRKDRDEVILDICRNKRVLHVGAADSPYTQEKFESGLLLHSRLASVASELIGIDLDEEAATWLNTQGLPEIKIVDLDEAQHLGYRPEVIIFGETIEHVTNLSSCLEALKSCMTAETKLVISTPNCFHLWFISMVLRNYEEVHDDHKVGFTYGLLFQLLRRCGLEISEFYFTFLSRERYPLWRRAWIRAARLRHGFSETLLAICTLKH